MSMNTTGMMVGSLLLDRPRGIENRDLCASCGGVCCKRGSGLCTPADFGEPLYDRLLCRLASGLYVVDYWEGLFAFGGWRTWKPYFVRPRRRFDRAGQPVDTGLLIDPSWGGQCIFYQEQSGCRLEFEKRPSQCRTLVPHKDPTLCVQPVGHGKRDCIAAWVPFQCVLKTLIQEHWNGKWVITKGES
jgi:hypothetical protein